VVAEQEKPANQALSMFGSMSSQSHTARILDDDAAVFSKLSPGTWIVQLILDAQDRSGGTIAETRVVLRAASQGLTLPIPPLYEVVVQAPALEPRTQLWINQ